MAGYKHLEIPGNFERYVKDKKQSANAYYRYFLARLSCMFEYKNLPDTIPHEQLDRFLMNNGIACITEVNGKLYAFYGNMGGPQDIYYRPTEFIISNPHIKNENGDLFTANIPIYNHYQPTEDVPGAQLGQPKGVLIRNDTEWFGLAPMLARYAFLMAENTLTLRTADVMLRVVAMLTAPSDKEKQSALEYIKAIEDGKLSVIGESPFFDGVKLQSPPSNNGSYLTQFIEFQQYLKGSLYNEIGLSANYNMKREAIGKGESTLDEDALLPLADNMLKCRREDIALVNELYADILPAPIEVSFSSAWLENELEALSTISQFSSGATQSFGASPAGNPFVASQGESEDTDDTTESEDKDVKVEEVGAEETEELAGAEGANGANESEESPDKSEEVSDEGTEEGGEGDSSSENPESMINDVGWSDTLQAAKENLEEKIEKGDEMNEQPVPLGSEETEDDAGDNPAD